MGVVLFRDREVERLGAQQIGDALAKRRHFIARALAEALSEIVRIKNDLAVEHARAAVQVLGLQAEVLDDEVMQRVGAEARVIVDFGHACFVGADAGKLAGQDLSAKPVARLEHRDPATRPSLRRQMPGRGHPPRTTPNYRNPEPLTLNAVEAGFKETVLLAGSVVHRPPAFLLYLPLLRRKYNLILSLTTSIIFGWPL